MHDERISMFGAVCCPRCNGTGNDPDNDATCGDSDCPPACLTCKGDGFVDDPTESKEV